MKPTHLKTLSATVDELYSLVTYGKITEPQFCNLIAELNDDLKTTVTLGHFVACDKNGKPLESITSQCEEAVQRSCASENGCECYFLELKYNVAQKHVIFEGWEVVIKDIYGNVTVKNKALNIALEFGAFGVNCRVLTKSTLIVKEYTNTKVKTLADLAAATESNPIKLK